MIYILFISFLSTVHVFMFHEPNQLIHLSFCHITLQILHYIITQNFIPENQNFNHLGEGGISISNSLEQKKISISHMVKKVFAGDCFIRTRSIKISRIFQALNIPPSKVLLDQSYYSDVFFTSHVSFMTNTTPSTLVCKF